MKSLFADEMIIYVENPKAIQSLLWFRINFRIKVLPLSQVVQSWVKQGLRESQGGASGVHKINADSDLEPVLSLRPLSKRHRARWCQSLPTWGPQTPRSCTRKTTVRASRHLLFAFCLTSLSKFFCGNTPSFPYSLPPPWKPVFLRRIVIISHLSPTFNLSPT